MPDVQNTRPKDRTSIYLKDTPQWKKQFFEYFDNRCKRFIDPILANKYYRIVNGKFDIEEYSYIANPLSTDRPELQGFPAKVRNYPIVPPVFQMLMSEKREMLHMPIVLAKNSEIDTIRNIVSTRLINKNLQQQFVNTLQQLDNEDLKESALPNLQTIQDIKKEIEKIPDIKSKLGADILEAFVQEHDVFLKVMLGWYYFLCTGKVASYKDVFNRELFYSIVPPENLRCIKTPDTIFLEDSEAVIADHYKTVNELYDMFQNSPEFESSGLKEFLDTAEASNIADGDEKFVRNQQMYDLFSSLFKIKRGGSSSLNNGTGIKVEHLNARSQQRVGILKRRQALGNIEEIEVDERYIPVEGEELTFEQREQIYEGFRINGKYLIDIQPYSLSDYKKLKGKLAYNGRTQLTVDSDPLSFAAISEPFQKYYNIIKYRIELTLGRNLDSLVVIPLGLMSDDDDWDEWKLLYYMQAMSVLFVDETNENVTQALQALKSFNMSMWQYVSSAHKMLDDIVAEYHSSVGASPQRLAQISTSAGKGTTDQAIYRSSLISLELFTEFEEFEKREYDGFLRLSKYTIKIGDKKLFLKANGQRGVIDTDSVRDFFDLEYSTHVTNSKKEKQKLESMKNQAQALAQNQASPSFISKIIDSDNYAELMEHMDKMEETLQENLKAQNEATAKGDQAKFEHEQLLKDKDVNIKKYEIDKETARDVIEKSGIVSEDFRATLDNIIENSNIKLDMQKVIDARQAVKEENVLKDKQIQASNNQGKK